MPYAYWASITGTHGQRAPNDRAEKFAVFFGELIMAQFRTFLLFARFDSANRTNSPYWIVPLNAEAYGFKFKYQSPYYYGPKRVRLI